MNKRDKLLQVKLNDFFVLLKNKQIKAGKTGSITEEEMDKLWEAFEKVYLDLLGGAYYFDCNKKLEQCSWYKKYKEGPKFDVEVKTSLQKEREKHRCSPSPKLVLRTRSK